ncbi:MAG: hypothetical protein JNL70_09070 [Saprospiraceae bacterium]|nr:hypothetical protein [Saprospiraceae bacterium]
MKKINSISLLLGKSINALTTTEMSAIRGGTANTDVLANVSEEVQGNGVGPLCATADDKRRDRPGGGISTH